MVEPELKKSTAGDQALGRSHTGHASPAAGAEGDTQPWGGGGHSLRGHPPRPWAGGPPAVPEGGQALLPPPGKGPGSAGRVTLAGWFLIFLARFFSLAPDISGRARGLRGEAWRRPAGAAEPLRSEGEARKG